MCVAELVKRHDDNCILSQQSCHGASQLFVRCSFDAAPARLANSEELPELLDFMREQCGSVLTRYLARRLVFFELRQDFAARRLARARRSAWSTGLLVHRSAPQRWADDVDPFSDRGSPHACVAQIAVVVSFC